MQDISSLEIIREVNAITKEQVMQFSLIDETFPGYSLLDVYIASIEEALEKLISKCLIKRKIKHSYYGDKINFLYSPFLRIIELEINNNKINLEEFDFEKKLNKISKIKILYEAGYDKIPNSLLLAALIAIDRLISNKSLYFEDKFRLFENLEIFFER